MRCPKGCKCENRCDEKTLFDLGDQSYNKCKYFEPSELAQRAQETFKLDLVDYFTI